MADENDENLQDQDDPDEKDNQDAGLFKKIWVSLTRNISYLLLGGYLMLILIAGLFIMASLMLAKADPDTRKTETVQVLIPATPQKAGNPNTAANSNANTSTNNNANVNSNTNVNSNSAANSDGNSTPDGNTTGANTNADIAVITDEKPEKIEITITDVRIYFWGYYYDLSADGYLFFIVLVAGFLGGIIRCIFSFFRHLGIGNFSFNWLAYYLMLPFGAATLSLVMYFVIRGGFYTSAIGKDLALNLFSFAALGTLTGLFSENAMEKLKQVAEVLLTKVEPKTDNVQNKK